MFIAMSKWIYYSFIPVKIEKLCPTIKVFCLVGSSRFFKFYTRKLTNYSLQLEHTSETRLNMKVWCAVLM